LENGRRLQRNTVELISPSTGMADAKEVVAEAEVPV
jgi:hypothetical protein